GCGTAGCTPISGFINTTTANLNPLSTTSTGITISSAVFATGAITMKGVVQGASGGAVYGITAVSNITSTNGDVNLNGATIASYGIYITSTSVVTGNNITITGTSVAAPAWDLQIGPLTINSASVGGSITVIGNVIGIPGAARGIYQIGDINGASGSNISFISNNNISQNGAVKLVANTSGTSANISYDATAGNKLSSITTGVLTITAGSTSNVNYSVLASGSAINIASAITVPGAVTLDNTYGCSGNGCAPAAGYLNAALTNWSTLVTTGGCGVLVGGNISGTAITINGINAGGSTASGGAVMLAAGLIATSGNININGLTTTGIAVGNLYGSAWGITPIVANSGAVNITGTSTTTGNGVELGQQNSISAKSITIIGSEVGGTYAVYLNTLTIVSGGTNLNVTGTVVTNTDTGIYQTGAIIDNAAGSNISFITNGKINQGGAISLVANSTSTAVSVTYNTTSGTKDSSVIAGALTIATGTNTTPINYIIKTAGAAMNPAAIGTSVTNALPGYVLLDNTYGCGTTGCTPISGFINTTTANLATLATATAGVTINAAIYANGNITVNGVSTNNAIDYSVAITSTAGSVSLNGGATTQRGIYNSTASTITANNITIIGTSTVTPVWDVWLGAMTINSAAIGGSISVTGNVIGIPGAAGGIYQSGAIAGASGSNISFISNNNIQQLGAISLVANTSGIYANITYDVTTGKNASSVIAAALSIPTGSTSAINYIIKTGGAAINPAAIGTSLLPLPGYVLLDNTYGCTGTSCTPYSGFINTTTANVSTLATTSVGVTVNSAIYANGNITVNGVSSSNAIDYSVAITSTGGNVVMNGGTTIQRGVYNSVASTITANNITLIGTSSAAPIWDVQAGALTINSASIGGSISLTGNYIGTPGAAGGVYQSGAITGASGSNISLISNNNIQQLGAISLVANTSGNQANITYDVTTGNKTSSVISAALSIPTGSISAINYIIKTAGAAINPAAIGTSLLPLPGYVLLDNTYGCTPSGCTPVSGYINTTTPNIATLATTSVGVTVNSAIYANGNITINGMTGAAGQTGIDYSVAVTSTGGNVSLNGGATTGRGVYNSVASTITANNITILGTSTAVAVWGVQLGAMMINSAAIGGSISVTGEVIGIPGAAGGIYQSGAIAGASGSNISFISNNNIQQLGAITLAANASGVVANILYNTTSGSNVSSITTAALTSSGTSTSAINYLVKTNGAVISVPAITIPGYILLDNTCLGCATAATPSTAAANLAGIAITSALSAGTLAGTTGVTINAVANGTGVGFTQGANAISSSAGGVTITVNGQTGTAYSSSGNITATGQAVTIATTTTTAAGISDTGTISGGAVTLTSTQSTSTATLTPIYMTGLVTANSLTVTGTGGASTTIVSLGAITINAGGGNISVTANNAAAGTNTGITQAGAIADNAVGSSISFISNNDIDQNGAIALVANTGTSAANIAFNTTAGNSATLIGTGTVAVTGTSTAAINFLVKSNGGIISVPAISVPGYILLDDSCLGCATATTTSTAAANGAAISITGALSAGTLAGATGVTINAVANGTGIAFNQGALAISSSAGGVTITANGQTGTAYYSTGNITATGQAVTIATTTTTAAGINDTGTITGGVVTLTSTQSTAAATLVPITATGLITANTLMVTGNGGASTTIVFLGAITLNAGGTNITVTANNATAGALIGITQTGAITDYAVGTNISFISNNYINQTGAITLVANTGTPAANIIYDTTAGNNGSKVTTGGLSVAGTSSAAINYIIKTNGAIISSPAVTVPGYILLDDSCLGCATATTTSTAAANGAAISITGALSAGSYAGTTGVTINAVANGSGFGFTQGALAISSLAGGVTITANSQTGIAYSSTGNITATGQAITITATTTTAASISDTGTISGGVVTIAGTQSTATATATPITATGLITANSLTVTGNGGASTTIVSLGAITINAGGGNITVTANDVAAGANTGITQTGAITDNAVGSNISFISNNKIAQSGAIALVANTGAPAANVIYDATAGNNASTIATGNLTFTTGTGSVINYIVKSAGSAIANGSIGTSTAALPGYVTLDNTYGCTTAPCVPVSGFITASNASTLAAASAGLTIANAIYTTGNINLNGVSNTASGVTYSAALNTSSGGINISGISSGTAAGSYGINASAAAGVVSASSTTAGVIAMSGNSAGSTSLAISTVASATITGASGVYLTGRGVGGGITTAALIKNSGTLGGLTVDAAGSVSLAGANNAGVTGMRIIAGNGIAAGTITGGDITALGTLTNTGGVIAISMAKPEASPYAIAGALGITTTNADATTNISYGIAGGMPVQPGNYVSGNYINYRQKITSTLVISVTINSDYTAVYGAAYNSNAANDWIQANSTVSFTGSSTATFGLAAITSASSAYIKSVLIFSPTVGGTTALNGTNANAVQTNTALTSTSISASDGSTVTVIPAGHKYTITPAVLGIAVSGVYNGTTTFTSANSTIATTGLAAWDTITSVTASSANANGASTYVTAIGGTASVGSFSASNYLIDVSYNGSLLSGLPVNASQVTATNKVSITPAPLGITVSGVYSGTSTITPTAYTVTGLVNSQNITGISAATVNNINVSANNSNYVTAITTSGGTASMSNYSITPAYNTLAGNTQNTVTLTPKSLTVTGITIGAKTYDGTTSASVTGGSLVGLASTDTANVTLAQSASFASANAANNVALIMVDSITGSASGNYTLVQPTGITANIARKAITVGGTSVAANKVYDGSTSALVTGGTLSGVITADLANVSLTQSGTFAQSSVGNGISVVVSTAIAGTAASNYVVTQPANLTANITQKTLTVTGTAITDKVYNGLTSATVTGGTLVGVVGLDAVSLTQAGTFASANVGSSIAVTMGDSISGAASGNYTLVQPAAITGKITPAPLGISVAATYSGSTTIVPATFAVTGLVNGETITALSSVVLDSMNVSANSANFVRSIAISSGTASASNYAFGTVASTTAGNRLNTVALTAKTLTVTGTLADKKSYDGTTSVNVWGGTLVGVIGVDVVNLSQAGVLNSPNAGSSIPVTVTDTISGFSAGNYNLVQPTGVTALITPKILTVSDGTVANKVYDGTINANITGGSLVGVLSGDTANVILTQTGRFSSPNVSNGIIIITTNTIAGSAASNYSLVQPTGITANITPAMLGISVVGVANGTNTITPISFTLSGLINGQTITGLSSVSVKSSSISSNGSNFVTGIVISGGTALATNYAFSPSYNSTATTSQNMVTLVAANQKILTVTGQVATTKVYDGTTTVTITGGTLVGVTPGDTVSLVQAGSLVNANVSSSASVILSDSLTGANAGNYILIQPTGITAIVTAAPLGIAVTGVYNGTTTITPTAFTPTGLVNGETITGLSSATVSNANVASNGSNFVTSIVSSGGTALLSNYAITQSYSATAGNTKNTATLTTKALTVGGISVADNKVYDGATAATISGGSLVGIIGSDAVTLNQSGTFAQANVGSAIAVAATDSLSGAAAGNYSLVQPTGLTANITAKTLTVGSLAVANKVYDGLNAATVTGGLLIGLVGADGANVTLSQTATFASINAANGIAVTSTASIAGGAASNYTLVQPAAITANITPKALTVTGTVVSNKTYDGTNAATVTAGALSGVISADTANVILTRAASFSSSNAGSAIPVTMSNSISGSAAGNYTLTQPSGITANISTKALTITAANVSSTYGTTTALGTSAFTQSGLVTGDAINAVTLQYGGSNAVGASVNAGTYTGGIVASSATGSGLSNYVISYVAGNLTVGQATITLAPTTQSAVYNGNAVNATTFSATAANYTVTGYLNTDSASNVPLSFTGSLGFTANGSTATIQNADTYGYSAGNLAITTTNTNYRVVLAGTLSNQYVVTPATVSLTASKVFDGTTTFTAGHAGTTLTVTTGVGSQTLSINGSANANSANVVGVSSLNTNGLSLVDGTGLASNYVLPASTGSVAITPKAIAVSIANQTKVYDTTTAATLTAGTSSTDGSYVLTGFMGNDGAYITQTAGSYNNANVASATTVTAAIGSAYVIKGNTVLSNYTLPTTASTAVNGATITKAPLTMTANDISTFIGVAPANIDSQYQLTGLLGADTLSSISNPTVTYMAGLINVAAITPNALTPSAGSSNYNLTFIKGSLVVANNYQMIVNAGSNTTSYGVVNSSNASYLGNALSSSNYVTAGYCTNCGVGVTSPVIINLTVAAPAAGSNVWTAADSLGVGSAQGKYSFVISPTINSGSYSAGGNLNVGNYVLTASSLQPVVGYTSRINPADTIYNVGSLSVTPKVITVTGTSVSNKTYDGTNLASVSSGQLSGLATGDQAHIALVQSGSFASINAANGITVNILDSLSGTVSANYVLTQPTGITANISAAPVTISGLSAASKVYNANTSATLSGTPTIIGLLGSDTATVTGSVTGVFADANAGTGVAITANLTSISLSNNNYSIAGLTAPLSADITPARITVSAAKTYDGTSSVSASQMSIAGVAGQTLVFTTGSTGTLTNPNVGSAAFAGLNNAALADGTGSASNYTLVNPVYSTVTITPAAITVGVDSLTKVYDRTVSTASTTVAPSLVLRSGSLFVNEATASQDALSGGSFVYADANAGSNKTVNVSNASVVSGSATLTQNYNITYQANTTSTIEKAAIIIGGLSASNKTYDTTRAAVLTGTPVISSGLVGIDTATLSGAALSGTFAGSDAGTCIAVTANLASLALSNPNYYVAGVASPLIANIAAAPVTISGLTTANKIYDTTTTAILNGAPTVAGLLTGDSASVSGAVSAAFASANKGNGLVVTADLSSLTLSNSNYYISGVTTSLSANITAAPITIGGLSASNKIYDATRVAALAGTPVIASGLLGSDSATLGGTATSGTFANANVGTALAVTADLSGLTLTNSNYYVAGISNALTANVAAAPVTISGLTAANKVYDTTTAVSLSGTPIVHGLLLSDSASTSGTVSAAFANANVGTAVGVTANLSGLTLSNTNYYIAGVTTALAANITAAPLTVTADNKVMIYGSSTPALSYTFSGLVGADAASPLNGAITTNASSSASVGNAYTITQGTLAATGNYQITTFNAGNVTINPRPVTVVVDSGQSKIYGSADPSAYTTTIQAEGINVGLLSGATLGGSLARASGENAGTYAVTQGTLASANPNYAIAFTGADFAITPRSITITASSNQSKVYGNVDGTLAYTVTSGSLVTRNSVTDTLSGLLSRASGELVNSYNITQGTVTNTLNPNYNISFVDSVYQITPRAITLIANTATKVYGTSDPSLGVTLTSGTLATIAGTTDSLASVSGTLTRSAGENVGAYNVLLGSGTGTGSAASNYNITFSNTNAAFSITRRDVTVTADAGQAKVYGAVDPVLTASIQSQTGSIGLVSGDALIGTLARATGETVASYAINQGYYSNANNANYNIIFVPANFAVTKRAITLTANTATKVYGTSDPSLGVTLTSGTLATIAGTTDSLASVSGTLTRSAGENVGAYNVLLGSGAGGGSAASNYNITFIANNQAVTITPATLTATGSMAYNGLANFSGGDLVITGVLGQTFSASGSAVMVSKNVQSNQALIDVSQLVLTGNAGALSTNYLPLNIGNTSVSVTPRSVSLTAPTINKVYDGGYTYVLTASDLAAMNGQLSGSDTFNAASAIFSGNNANVGTGKVVLLNPATVVINDGNSGHNYTVSYVNSTGNITPAQLYVTAANDAKFSVQADTAGYAGALYKGFVNGESIANLPAGQQTLAISRSDATNNAVGNYTLTPSGLGASGATVGNYQVNYINGTYKILGAQDLLIRASSISTYGTAPVYTFTAQYLAADGTSLSYVGGSGLSVAPVNLSSTGSAAFTLNDGSGTLTAGLVPVAAGTSASGNTNAGQYNVAAATGWSKTGSSFQNLVVVGTSIVSPLVITTPSLSGASISKVYDGSAVVSSAVTNLMTGSSQLIAGDAATLSASGVYDNKNVGAGKTVTVNFGISGNDAANYTLSTSQISGAYGAITQLASVTYIGPVGGDWATASNWAGGAIPDLSNVANVIIPTGASVTYGAGVAGPVTSQVTANGALNLANAGAAVSLGGISGSGSIALGPNSLTLSNAASGNFSGAISGSGGLTVAGGTQTLSGTNTYTGNTAVDLGATLIISGAGTLGGGNYAGTIANNGSLVYASSASQTLSGVISGSGSLTERAIPTGAPV
ncbi:YDG domain-containing protein, partial [Polynucleobacter sp. MWH-Adler-W8]|uniref:beta strand repeat-containing protein n=1 Tax=Polynucleobacter sp. MWH-Adler-W8 TaxID=1819727 RepID=UPI000927B008